MKQHTDTTPTPNANAQSNAPKRSSFRAFEKCHPIKVEDVRTEPWVPHPLWELQQPIISTDIGFITTKETYGWLHCMSAFPIDWEGKRFPSAEHFFQWLRFSEHPAIQEKILEAASPFVSKLVARAHKDKLGRVGRWDESQADIKTMRRVLRLKLDQHPDLAVKLKATGKAVLVEDCSSRDRESARFWGAVKAHNRWHGDNVLGCLWMELRDTL